MVIIDPVKIGNIEQVEILRDNLTDHIVYRQHGEAWKYIIPMLDNMFGKQVHPALDINDQAMLAKLFLQQKRLLKSLFIYWVAPHIGGIWQPLYEESEAIIRKRLSKSGNWVAQYKPKDQVKSLSRLPYGDNSIDVIYASKHLPIISPRGALNEFHRVLRTGGLFVFPLNIVNKNDLISVHGFIEKKLKFHNVHREIDRYFRKVTPFLHLNIQVAEDKINRRGEKPVTLMSEKLFVYAIK